MTLEATFQNLCSGIAEWSQYVQDLRVTIVEDKPLGGDRALIDQLGDATYDVRGHLEEALEFADEARRAVEMNSINSDLARRRLASCNERINNAMKNYLDLISYERVGELVEMGAEFGREGQAWVGSVKSALDQCRQMMHKVNQLILQSWLELTDRMAISPVAVHATNIGQQINAAEVGLLSRGHIP